MMGNDRIAIKGYMGEGLYGKYFSRWTSRNWADSLNDCVKKSLDVVQVRKMVHDRNEWQGFMRANAGV